MPTNPAASVAHKNLHAILEVVREAGTVSRREVAQRTGLSPATVTRHVTELVDAGVVRLADARGDGQAGPGRPARALSLDPGFGRVLGVDVGEHTIRASVADFAGGALASKSVSSCAAQGRDASLARLLEAIDGALAMVGDGKEAPGLHASVIGVPGIVRVEDGCVVDAPNFPGWRDLPLRALLQERRALGVNVRVENDVNLAAVGESAHGAGRGHDSFVFVSIRRGIGAGLVLDGQLRRGHAGMAGEIGFMAFDAAFDHREAHGLGHLETRAGEQSLLDRAQASDPARWRRDGPDPADPSLRDLCLAAADGDSGAATILDEALRQYAVAVANIVSLLDPQLVIVGGDVAVIGETAVARIREGLHRLVPHAPILHAAALGEEAVLKGALHQANLDACVMVPGVIHPLATVGGTA